MRASRWAGETSAIPPSASSRAESRPAQRRTSSTAASPGAVGDSALSTPATMPRTSSGTHTSACTEATAGR